MRLTKVKQLPVHRGPAPWAALLGSVPPTPEFGGRHTADFVVIGAGFAGLSAARRLTQLQPGARIVVLEAGLIAEGAAGRNSGFMIDLPHVLTSEDYAGHKTDQAGTRLNRTAIAFARAAAEDYGITPHYVDPAGKINGAASAAADQKNQSYARHLEDIGEPYELLDARQMQDITGSSHYVSGLFSPGTVLLQPAGYMRGLASGLRKRGVGIFENSPVIAFENSGSGWDVITPSGRVSAARVIVTVNGHLESFGHQRGRLLHLFLFGAMTPELDPEQSRKIGGQPRWGVTPSDPMGTTMRRIDSHQGGNRIITRSCAVLRPDMVASARDLARASRVMQRKFDQRFPALSGLPMQYQWAGHLCLTQNDVAVMREIERNLFSGCVQNGLGTVRGTLTGIGAAELACGVSSDITAYFSSEPAPRRLPPRPLLETGANMVLRWREWMARDD